MKRILLCLLCAALLTGCGKETDPAVAAAQRYQPIVQAVGDGTAVGVDLTDAQIAQAVAELDAAGLTAVHVDAAEPVTHPEAVAAFWAARAAGEKASLTLYEVCRDGGNLGARQAMLAASYQAGFAFTRAGVGNVHAIAHTLGGLYDVGHGLANAVLLPVVLEDYGPAAGGSRGPSGGGRRAEGKRLHRRHPRHEPAVPDSGGLFLHP